MKPPNQTVRTDWKRKQGEKQTSDRLYQRESRKKNEQETASREVTKSAGGKKTDKNNGLLGKAGGRAKISTVRPSKTREVERKPGCRD